MKNRGEGGNSPSIYRDCCHRGREGQGKLFGSGEGISVGGFPAGAIDRGHSNPEIDRAIANKRV